MASTVRELGFQNERSKKRRHSYTSARIFAAKPAPPSPLTPTHTSSGLKRTGSLSERSTHSEPAGTERTRRSFLKFLRSKKKRSRSSLTSSLSATKNENSGQDKEQEEKHQHATDFLAEQKGEFVRVIATVLHPQIQYKTLPITQHTTVYEVIVKLVSKYAQTEEDPDNFYMTEVRESEQGSYSRLLDNSDRVYDIQTRWDNGRKCSFTLCRREIFNIDDDPFLDNPLQAVVMSPSQDFFSTDFTGVVDIDVPSTPTSPNTYNAKTSFFDGPLLTEYQSSVLPVSPSERSVDEVFLVSKENSRKSQEEKSYRNGHEDSPVDVGQLMQKSISEGMLGIMNKVVSESRRHDMPTKQKRAIVHDFTPRKGRELPLRTLVASPMESTVGERKYPEFVFTPKPSQLHRNQAVEGCRLSFDDDSQPTVNQPDTPLYKTTHTLSTVKFASSFVFYPRYSSTASLYPSFSRNTLYTTAMDITDTLYSMLENQLQTPSGDLPALTEKEDIPNKHRIAKSKLKRHHTFHVRRDHLQLHLQDGSPAFRDHLVQRAAQAIRQRHSVSSLRLSEGESNPRLSRTGSTCTSASRGSSMSIGSEVETDLDALRDLKANRLASYSSERSLSPRAIHSRTDSDGIVDLRSRGMRQGRSSGHITTLDHTHYGSYQRKISDSYLALGTQIDHETSFHSNNRMYKSVEAINTNLSTASDEEEVLYTFQNNLRPVTVLVRSTSTHGLQEEEESTRADETSTHTVNMDSEEHSTNLRDSAQAVRSPSERREIWTFNQRRSQRRTKSWLSEL